MEAAYYQKQPGSNHGNRRKSRLILAFYIVEAALSRGLLGGSRQTATETDQVIALGLRFGFSSDRHNMCTDATTTKTEDSSICCKCLLKDHAFYNCSSVQNAADIKTQSFIEACGSPISTCIATSSTIQNAVFELATNVSEA